MKNAVLICFCFLLISTAGYSQFGYTDYQKVDDLQISTKWAKARDADGKKKPALLLGLENTTEHAIAFSFEILFYYEGILRETGQIDEQCLDGLTSKVGRLNGVYFIPQNFTPEQLKNSDFMFKIESIEVEQVEECPEETEE